MGPRHALPPIMERREVLRRTFVKGTLLAPVAFALGGITLGSQSAEAVPAAALLVVAQAAVAVARLFSPAGPSVNDILAQQTEMLLAMYKQLEVVQAKLDEVLGRLDEIQKELGKLPDKIVQALNESTIKSLPTLYKELRQAYAEDTKRLGIARAREVRIGEFKQAILNPLTAARTQLFQSDSPVNTPILALALHVEIGTRIIVEDTVGRVSAALTAYGQWFTKQQLALTQRRKDLRTSRDSEYENVDDLALDIFCVKARGVDESQRHVRETDHNEDGRMIFVNRDRGEAGTTRSWDVRVERREYETVPTELSNELATLVGSLESERWLVGTDRPMKVRQAVSNPQVANICKVAITQDWRSNNPSLVPASPDSVQRAEEQGDCSRLDERLQKSAEQLSDQLTDSGFALLHNAALLACASRALGAIEDLRRKEIGLENAQ
jgi:hypothetical protein